MIFHHAAVPATPRRPYGLLPGMSETNGFHARNDYAPQGRDSPVSFGVTCDVDNSFEAEA
jgi:hypothetical protein